MDGILAGLAWLGTTSYWLAFFAAVLMAAAAGLVPGLSATLLMALAVPFIVFNIQDPVIGIVMLATITAVEEILDVLPIVALGYPGVGQVTFLEARPLVARGYAARTLGFIYVVAACGGLIGAIALLLIIPIIKPFILQFSFAEIGAIGIFGVAMVGALSRGAMIKGIASGAFGMLLSAVGLSVFTGEARYTFGQLEFQEGLPLIATVVGLFALPEMADLLMTRQTVSSADATFGTREVFKGARIALKYWKLIIRHSLLGVFLGAIPGIGARVVSWLSYGIGISMTKNRRQFGRGSYRGLVFSEAVQSSKEGGHAIPTLALGVPAGQAWVFVLVAMIAYGVSPGPQFLSQHTDIVVLIVVSLVLGNAMLATIGMLWSGRLAKLSRLPYPMLCAVIVPLAILSAFQETRHWTAVPIVLGFACLGFVMKYFRWPRPPLVLGFILGKIVEQNMLTAISLYGVVGVLERPLTVGLIIGAVVIAEFLTRIGNSAMQQAGVQATAEKQPWRWQPDNYVALFFALVGAFFAIGAANFRLAARTFPMALGIILLLLALLQFVRNGWQRGEAEVLDIGMMSKGMATTRQTAPIILGLIAMFLVIATAIGLQYGAIAFAAATPVALGAGKRPWLSGLITGAIMAAVVIGLFDQMLNVMWPDPLVLSWVQDSLF
ncbi:MAG TPA: tripartite tricarboxylate transporter permease [Stellaceae bacterium]|jgi:TctA family transporter|nr:tripartite tricarboxylate transporter permease [Stellaceae bacterium]